ncbi:MAG: hypothetical protein CVT99_02680 [Bacteroidetes bacterium HGW-Bacteroidetes-16]|jgi:PAS domain S-box-containing protein|nr:MAG: hypothetical protein CVT99_02680 [Bacteroidetes bacterium HGW-Bacteroidetes-16]
MIKLLSIDDQRDNQIVIKGALSSVLLDTEFHFASSGKEGIAEAKKEHPDVILLDIMMPGMDGFETCRQLKSDPELNNIPIILLSSIGHKTENRIKGLETGADAVMSKPFDPGELASQIHVMLRIKRAEDKLREENTKLDELVNEKVAQIVYQATVLESVSDAVISSDTNFLIKSWNEAAERTYGWTESEVLGRGYGEVLKPQYVGTSQDEVEEHFRRKGRITNEVIHEHKNGHKLNILTSVSKLINRNGENIGTVALNHDVSKEKEAEKEIANLTARLELAVKAVELGIWEWDLNTNQLNWNDEFSLMYGITESAPQHPIKIFRKYVCPEDINRVLIKIRELIKSGDKVTLEHSVNNPAKGTRLVISKAVLDKDDKGIAIRIIGVSYDVTQRMKMEVDLKHSEERYRTMVENSNDLVWVTDKQGCFTFFNQHVEDVTGFQFDKFIGKPYNLLLRESDKDWVAQEYARVVGGEKRQFEIMVLFAGGVEHILWVNLAPVIEGNKIVGVVTFARDVSDYHQAIEDFKMALDKAKDSDRLKSAFLANMSHELRTPLNAIMGFSSLMDINMETDEVGKYAKIINDSGKHLLYLVEQLFDITLIDSGQIKLSKETFDLIHFLTIIRGITLSERAALNRDHLEVIFKFEPSMAPISIYTDKKRLQQILLNLLKNALKFTEEGTVECGFEKRLQHGKPVIRFYVRDTGIGIPQAKRRFIFDAFRQADDSHTRKYDGVGLGLSIAKKLALLLGGTLNLSSIEGVGSTFWFSIPYSGSEESGKERGAHQPEISFKGRKVLIVEDDIDSYHLLELVLLKYDGVPVWAHNGQEAVSYCTENELPWIVLMDLNMPLMDGFEATRILKQRFPDLPIIVQTAYAMKEDVRKSKEAGCDDFISKPLIISKLLEVMLKYNR